MKQRLFLIMCVCGLFVGQVSVVGASFPVLREIKIEGNERVDTEKVLSHLSLEPGHVYDKGLAEQSLKSLYGTGLFSQVILKRLGDVLLIKVVENPIINRVAFEGNSKLSDDVLKVESKLRPREVFSTVRVQKDVKRILELYRRSGHFAATVDPKIIRLPENRVDLVYEIDEGKSTLVQRIIFIGNRHYATGDLQDVLATKEARWYRFFSSVDTYDPDRVLYDRELLRRFYRKNGYADFRIVSVVSELTPDREDFFLTFTIDEGERYKVNQVDVDVHIKGVDAEPLQKLVDFKEGDWFDGDLLDRILEKLTDALGDMGYAFIDVVPQIEKDSENNTLNITFIVQEGPKVYIDRINVEGNDQTDVDVVLREFRLTEGDPYNASKLKQSEKNLNNLGFFKKVDISSEPGDAPDRANINVKVEEERTGELSLAGAYSTLDGPGIETSYRQTNLMGRGQELFARAGLGRKRYDFSVDFTEPYFMSRPLEAGVSVFNMVQMKDSGRRTYDSSYDHRTTGAGVHVGYRLAENLRQTWSYTLNQDSVTNVGSQASRFIKEQSGVSWKSAIGHVLFYDRRDNIFEPTSGYYLKMSNEFAGLGGKIGYMRHTFSAGTYYSPFEGWVLALKGVGGTILKTNKKVRIVDRFVLGAESFRGFAYGGIGPRDKKTDDALRGLLYYTGTAELFFPLGLPKEFGMKGSIFTDVGSLWKPGDPLGETIGSHHAIRAASGVGLSWTSPMGPIRVSYSRILRRKTYDKREAFLISFSTRY